MNIATNQKQSQISQEFNEKITNWVYDKHLNFAPKEGQAGKIIEEFNELKDALVHQDYFFEALDAIGDMYVAASTLYIQMNDRGVNYDIMTKVIAKTPTMKELNKTIRAIQSFVNKGQYERASIIIETKLFVELNAFCNQYQFNLRDAVSCAYSQIKRRAERYHEETGEWY